MLDASVASNGADLSGDLMAQGQARRHHMMRILANMQIGPAHTGGQYAQQHFPPARRRNIDILDRDDTRITRLDRPYPALSNMVLAEASLRPASMILTCGA